MDHPRFSIVIPVFNEAETLPELAVQLATAIDPIDGEWEILLVDDGSVDDSYNTMLRLADADPRFKVIRLSRNFGHQIAITAGIDLAVGEAVIIMDGDLQHPPAVIPELVAQWRAGFDIVYGVMRRRDSQTWLKRATSRAYYRLLRRLADIDVPLAAGDFRLVDRRALEGFKLMRERNRYVRGMFSWIGFRQIGVAYDSPRRFAGRSKYTSRRMVRLGFDGILSFSILPLRFVLNFGFVVALCSFIFGVANVIAKIASAFVVPGWVTLVVVISFGLGVQLVVLGMIGEYLGRIYDEVKQRPLYLVSGLYGFDREVAPEHRASNRLQIP
jgi:glycosyltransferase involved in cell wall biosynthesis